MKLLKITSLSGFFLVVLVFGALTPLIPAAAQQPFTACDQINPAFQPGTCQFAGDTCGNKQGCHCNVAPNDSLCCYDPGAFPPGDRCYSKNGGQRNDNVSAAPADVSSVAIEPVKADISFIPQITLPGSKFIAGQEIAVSGNTLGEWIAAVYVFFVSACSIVATVMMMYGGYKYVISFGSAQKMSDAQDQIVSAMVGLALSLGAYMILLTISPNLVKCKTLSIPPVQPILQGLATAGQDPSEDYGEGDMCLLLSYAYMDNTFTLLASKDAEEAMRANLVQVNFASHTVSVHMLAAAAFTAVDQEIGTILSRRQGPCRDSRQPDPVRADPDQAKICADGGLISDIPGSVIDVFRRHNFQWGGGWTSVKDPMHFEWRGGPCFGGTSIF
ncbi:MAG: hypothetical protein UY34_C0004G0044 [Parcubacteria group bacterium GW2011_GWA2_48_9]|nr:MAG: hypothetical protein UY34_C0004G0044 [Parcubacteria group bacterium GW2011_GWA2_48_9]